MRCDRDRFTGRPPSWPEARAHLGCQTASELGAPAISQPEQLRQFARACGVLAKNDRLDAQRIAEYVAIMPTRQVRSDPAAERPAEIVTMRRQLCDEHVAAENQARHLEDAMLRRIAKRRLARVVADIRLLDKRLAELVAAESGLARRFRLLRWMPGVGATLAYTLLALLPELGAIGCKQIAALVGLAPYDFCQKPKVAIVGPALRRHERWASLPPEKQVAHSIASAANHASVTRGPRVSLAERVVAKPAPSVRISRGYQAACR